MGFSFTTPTDVTVAGAVKLKQGVILKPEFHYFDKDRISTESSLLKVFLPVRLIHRFTSPFQLRQLQYSMVLQLAAAEKKGKQASYWQWPYKSVLCHTRVSAHERLTHFHATYSDDAK